MIRGILFDLDGVIVYTDRFHYLAWKRLSEEEGIPFDEEFNLRFRGVSRSDCLALLLERANRFYTEREKEELSDRKNRYYRGYLEKMSPNDVSSGVRDTLSFLRREGYLLALASASKNAPLILEKTGLTQSFDAVVDGNMVHAGKPNPEVFLKAAQAIGVPPEDAMVVEDSSAGLLAGKRGGFTTVGIGPSRGDPNADYSISAFSDLLLIPLLKGRPVEGDH